MANPVTQSIVHSWTVVPSCQVAAVACRSPSGTGGVTGAGADADDEPSVAYPGVIAAWAAPVKTSTPSKASEHTRKRETIWPRKLAQFREVFNDTA